MVLEVTAATSQVAGLHVVAGGAVTIHIWMSGASLLWDALLGVGAYGLAMWAWWVPVLLAVATSIAVRPVRARTDSGWLPRLAGLVWLGSMAVFMTVAG